MADAEPTTGKEGAFTRRLKEKLFVWRKLFLQNWALFKASRIGVVGLSIMIAFVILALSAPFMGLRDPIRWTAPDEDLISVRPFSVKESTQPGSELRSAMAVNEPVAFRVLPDTVDARADRIYVAMGDRLYAFLTEPTYQLSNAWGVLQSFNVTAVDGALRNISAGPLLINYGQYTNPPADYELYVGTDDGALFILQDPQSNTRVPTPYRLDFGDEVTGLAAFNGDELAPAAIQGYAYYASRVGSQWSFERVSGIADRVDEGEYADLALDAAGHPTIAFYDFLSGRPRVASRPGTVWAFNSSEATTSQDIGLFTSLALDLLDGSPHIVYYDAPSGALKYAHRNATGEWNPVFLDVGGIREYPSLALNALGLARVAYHDATVGSLKYAEWNGTAWSTIETVETGGVGRGASLVLNTSGLPRISYYDATTGSPRYAARNESGSWSFSTVDLGGGGQNTSLVLDASGRPHIAYYDEGNGNLKYAFHDGSNWIIEDADDAAEDVGRYASLDLDSAGYPAVAYFDATNLDLKYAVRNATEWSATAIASRGNVGMFPSLKFDASNRPHIAYHAFETGRTDRDVLVVGTMNGNVSAIDLSIPKTITQTRTPAAARTVVEWDYRVRWTVNVGSEVHLAMGPLRSISLVPLFSPAFHLNGEVVYLGTKSGRLWALSVADGSSFWTESDGVTPRSVRIGTPWTSAPIVATAAEGPLTDQEVVYAGSDYFDYDGDNATQDSVSLLYARLASDGSALPEWSVEFASYAGGAPVSPSPSRVTPDGGSLSQPSVGGGVIYLGSTSGYLYAYRRDAAGIGGSGVAPASLKWAYRDPALQGFQVRFTSPAVVLSERGILLANADHNAGTPDPTDDKGVVYSMKLDGVLSWKRTVPAVLAGYPASWTAPRSLGQAVFVGYGDASVTGVASLSSTGQFLAPSAPSWAHEYNCPTLTDPNKMCPGYPSGNQYWLGLDSQGRDIFSQVIWGSRIALLVGFMSAFFSVLLGTVVGLVAGYVGGRVESVLMRFTDVILVLPGLPLIITLAAVLGASIWNIILVISLLGWPGIARITRAEVLSLKERPFIDSARVTGASTTRVVFRHIAPNVLPLAFLYMTFAVSGAILSEASLSFIGLGDVSTMSWGIMLQLVSQSKTLTAWWWLLPPGLAITMISLSFFLIGRAFDEIVNPRLRKR